MNAGALGVVLFIFFPILLFLMASCVGAVFYD